MLDLIPSTTSNVKIHTDPVRMFHAKARALSRLRRWNGACDVSVAQHCVMA